MKKFILISALLFAAGCASDSIPAETVSPSFEDSVPATSPVPVVVPEYNPKAAPEAVTATSIHSKKSAERSCRTPLGEISHGGTLTGWMQPTVPPDEVCVSDTLRCNNGVWSGKAVHKSCTVRREKK